MKLKHTLNFSQEKIQKILKPSSFLPLIVLLLRENVSISKLLAFMLQLLFCRTSYFSVPHIQNQYILKLTGDLKKPKLKQQVNELEIYFWNCNKRNI